MVIANARAGIGECRSICTQDGLARLHFDGMALVVIKADGFDVIILIQRPRQARCGVLSAGKKNERFGRHGRVYSAAEPRGLPAGTVLETLYPPCPPARLAVRDIGGA